MAWPLPPPGRSLLGGEKRDLFWPGGGGGGGGGTVAANSTGLLVGRRKYSKIGCLHNPVNRLKHVELCALHR